LRVDLRRVVEGLRSLNSGVIEPFDLVFAVLHAFGGRAPSRVHVHCALFVASRHLGWVGEVLEFKAYRMGPWSEEVDDVLEVASHSGLLTVSRGGVALTRRGTARAGAVWGRLSDGDRRVLEEVAGYLGGMGRDELLLYIYTVYGYTWESDVIARLLGRRRRLALSMLGKGLVSVELASRIAGMPLQDFVGYLKRRGLKPYTALIDL